MSLPRPLPWLSGAVLFASLACGGLTGDGDTGFRPILEAPPPISPPAIERKTALISQLAEEAVVGDPTAPVVVVQYSDFLCPHCERAWSELTAALRSEPEVQLWLRPFPLSGRCNPMIDGVLDFDDPRCRLALGAECARRQYRFEEFAQLLFDNQASLRSASREDVLVLARAVPGLDPERLGTCLDAPDVQGHLLHLATTGIELGLEGTPTFFVRTGAGAPFELVQYGADDVIVVVEAALGHHLRR